TCVHGPPTSVLYSLSLHDALPILPPGPGPVARPAGRRWQAGWRGGGVRVGPFAEVQLGRSTSLAGAAPVRPMTSVMPRAVRTARSEEHTSELQSRENLVCRLLLEK